MSAVLLPRKPIWEFAFLGFSLVVFGCVAWFAYNLATAVEKGVLGGDWPEGERVSMDEIDHSAWDTLLKRHVDVDGLVDYAAWKETNADRRALRRYLTDLGRASREANASKAARLAFWINAYNAVTVEGILQEYPTSSIRNHTSKLGGYDIWSDLPLQVGGEAYSLDAMEHEILRKQGEPRIHFAIVCASIGCPRLLNRAYTAEKLDQQLAVNATDFFSRPKHFRYDPRTRTMHVSSILDWFGDDFGATQVERFRVLQPYLPEDVRSESVDPATRVEYLDYDWDLNDASQRSE